MWGTSCSLMDVDGLTFDERLVIEAIVARKRKEKKEKKKNNRS